jgi:hypothetical protein
MPRPFLPEDQKKDFGIKVRFLKSDLHILETQARKHNCKTISAYIRKLVKNDVASTKRKTLPDIC